MSSLSIAFFEPWFGGSHRAFLEAWGARTRHRLAIHALAPRHWKWRQESSAWELAREVDAAAPPDVIACSGYVDLPRLHGFLPRSWADRPSLMYFHETQLTYPGGESERDLTHGFSNILSAVRADRVVFNSRFHLDEFRGAADQVLRRLPRPTPRAALSNALDAAEVVPPMPELAGVPVGPGGEGPLRIAFPHRLEPDKDPVTFADALVRAASRGASFEVELLGGHTQKASSKITEALARLAPWLRNSEHIEDRARYLEVLGRCDLVASTARHEFFGVAFAEAMAAGCSPLAPGRLNYPALLADHDGGAAGTGTYLDLPDLTDRLVALASAPRLLRGAPARGAARDAVMPFDAAPSSRELDRVVEGLAP